MHELTRLNVSKRILTEKEKLKKLWYKMKTIVPPVLSPHFKQDIDLIENVQRSVTRKLFYCCNLVSKSCVDRLTYLGLQRLELSRIYADLIYMFKLIHNNISSSLINVFKFNNQVHCRETINRTQIKTDFESQ